MVPPILTIRLSHRSGAELNAVVAGYDNYLDGTNPNPADGKLFVVANASNASGTVTIQGAATLWKQALDLFGHLK